MDDFILEEFLFFMLGLLLYKNSNIIVDCFFDIIIYINI